jgi:hypothetical protein
MGRTFCANSDVRKTVVVLLTASFYLILGLLCYAAEEPQPLPQKPDLDVTYISQRPLYHGYWMDYPNDVPTFWVPDKKAPDGKRTVTKEEFQKLVKCYPAEGDKVTFTAHIRNNGFAPSPATNYKLYIDDKVEKKGDVKALQPDEEMSIPFEWIYKEGRHTISCEVDSENKIDEICEINNRLTDPTWGIGLTIRAGDEGNYKGFRSTTNLWGSYSFEDWCQAHIQEWRRSFREAKYPATPQGILQGIRFDGIYTSLNDPARQELIAAIIDSLKRFGREYTPDPKGSLESETCAWRIYWKYEDIPNYAKKIDGGLIHELCHQCGIIDLYQIGMSLASNLVPDPNGHFIWVAEGCYNQFCDLMAVYGENPDALPQRGLFREHTAAGFNSEIGKPRWGFGLYLFDLPQHNVLRVLDNRGNAIKGAKIKLYQQEIEKRTIGKIPPKTGLTDENGEWDMGSHPIDKIHVVATNAIMLFEILAYDQWEYHTLTITEMNVAYWRGDKERHVYQMETGIAPSGSVPAPTNFLLKPLDTKKAVLTWDYPSSVMNVQKFLVMKREGHVGTEYKPAFEKIVGETYADKRTIEVDIKAPRDIFTVVAVDEMGNRSGYSNFVIYPADEILPEVARIWSVVQTPDGSIYVLNSDWGTLFGLTPKGARLSFADSITFETPEIVTRMAGDKDGILYIPNYKSNCIHRVNPAKEKKLDDMKLEGTQKPRGITIDKDENIYISDIGTCKIHIFTKSGKPIASFGGAEVFAVPMNVYVDGNGSVYVVDCPPNKENFRLSNGTVLVFKRKSKDLWEFESTTTIKGLQYTECVITDDKNQIYAGGSGGIHVFNDKGEKITQWQAKPYGCPAGAEFVFDMAWNKDGSLLVVQGFTIRQLIRVTLDEIFAKPQQ